MCRSLPDRNLNCDRIRGKARADLLEHAIKVRPFAIQFVNEYDPRYTVLVGLSPNRFALRFNPFTRGKDHDCAIEYTEATFYLGGKIDVAWCIQQIDRVVFPFERNARSEDGNPALLLFWIVIRFGRSGIDSTCSVLCPTHVEHLLRDGGFARIDVGDDSNITKGFQFSCHDAVKFTDKWLPILVLIARTDSRHPQNRPLLP